MTDILETAAKFGPILKQYLPDLYPIERMKIADALAETINRLAASPECPQAASAEVREALTAGDIEEMARCAGRDVAARNGGPAVNGNIQSAAVAGARSALRALAAVPAHAPSAGEERVSIVTYLRKLSAVSRQAHADYAADDADDEILDRWIARMEDYAFVADQIERGIHSAAPTGNADAESGS